MGKGARTGTGTGNRDGTGTIMWRGTDTRTRTSLTLIYFSSNYLILIQFIQKIRKLAWDNTLDMFDY